MVGGGQKVYLLNRGVGHLSIILPTHLVPALDVLLFLKIALDQFKRTSYYSAVKRKKLPTIFIDKYDSIK